MKICGMRSSTFFKIINMLLGVCMVTYSVLTFLNFFSSFECKSFIICICFQVYEVVFGLLLVIAFCDFKFIALHFGFLKTTTGKGLFNLFLSSMFLIGSAGGNPSITGWIFFVVFLICGVFFVIIGCW